MCKSNVEFPKGFKLDIESEHSSEDGDEIFKVKEVDKTKIENDRNWRLFRPNKARNLLMIESDDEEEAVR